MWCCLNKRLALVVEKLKTRGLCVVAQHDNALEDFVDNDTHEKLNLITFKRYKHEPLS